MKKTVALVSIIAFLSLCVYGMSTSLPAPVLDDPISPTLYPPSLFEISKDQQNSIIFVKVYPTTDIRVLAASPNPDPVSEATSFLDSNKALFGISDVNSELLFPRVEKDGLGMTHVTYFQFYNGIPVYRAGVQVNLGNDGLVNSVTPRVASGLSLSTVPTITPSQAGSIALASWQRQYPAGPVPNAEVSPPVIFPKSLVNNDGKGEVFLAYPARVYYAEGEEILLDDNYYVDASNGNLIEKISNNREFYCPLTGSTVPPCRKVYDCDAVPGSSSCNLDFLSTDYSPSCSPNCPPYYFGRSEGNPTRGPDPRPNPPSMFGGSNNTDQIFDSFLYVHKYYNYTYNRFGANKRGGSSWGANENYTRGFSHLDMAPIGLINCPGGHAWFAGSTQMIFFCLNTITSEMMGHEYAHAVLFYEFYNSSGWPVGPIYYGQTGALDESHADLQGTFFERDNQSGTHDWIIGGVPPMNWSRNIAFPELTQNSVDGKNYPNRFYDPNFYCGTDDNAGVHVGLSVPSKAAYLAMVGGSFNGCEIPAIGEPAFQQIIYRTWDAYASSTESFNAFVVHMNQSCQDLYSSTHPEYCTSLVKAYQAVEMDQAGKCSNGTEAPPACAVKNLAAVYTKKANGVLSTSFAPTEAIWVGGENGTAGKTVTFYLIRRNGTISNWTKLYSPVNVSAVILANGSINASFGVVNQTGTYDLIADGSNDGYYHQWADASSTVQVAVYSPDCTPIYYTTCMKNRYNRIDCIEHMVCK